jgi:heat shock protein HslJ
MFMIIKMVYRRFHFHIPTGKRQVRLKKKKINTLSERFPNAHKGDSMKKITIVFLLLVVISSMLIAGCTKVQTLPAPTANPTPAPLVTVQNQQGVAIIKTVATTAPTPVPTTVVTVAPTAPLTDPALTGNWTLKGIMVGAGSSAGMPQAQITITFNNDGTLSGFGGCNNYNANYVLTGKTTSFGKTISIGPIISTKKFCAVASDQESTYLANLQNAETYSITTNNMMIRTSTLSQLSYVNGLV